MSVPARLPTCIADGGEERALVSRTACSSLCCCVVRLYHVRVFLAFVLGDLCEKNISMCIVVVGVVDGVRLKVFPNADDEKLKNIWLQKK